MLIQLLEPSPQIRPELLEYLTQQGHTVVPYGQTVDNQLVEAIIVRSAIHVDAALIDSYPSLRYICRIGVGLEHIDTVYAASRDITILNTPGANTESVADLALRGAISLLRKSLHSSQYISADRFQRMGDELRSRKIGLRGYGHIGKAIARRCIGYGCKDIVVYDPYVTSSEHLQVSTTAELVTSSDCIFVAVPLLPSTRNMIDATVLEQARPDTLWINTSRGAIIDEAAMLVHLQKKSAAGYYADVRADEPTITPVLEQLRSCDNAIITGHIGAMTHQASAAMHQFDI